MNLEKSFNTIKEELLKQGTSYHAKHFPIQVLDVELDVVNKFKEMAKKNSTSDLKYEIKNIKGNYNFSSGSIIYSMDVTIDTNPRGYC